MERRIVMSQEHIYTIVTSQTGGAARLAWVSPSTGLTYCGICQRSPVSSRIGARCATCGANVSGFFDLREGGLVMKRAWRKALSLAHGDNPGVEHNARRASAQQITGSRPGTCNMNVRDEKVTFNDLLN
jgi:hypothetical protein